MNRTQKIALLTKVMQGDAPASRLQQVMLSQPRQSLIIIVEQSDKINPESNNDPAYFTYQGKQHRMTLGEAYQYADQNRLDTIFILPAKC